MDHPESGEDPYAAAHVARGSLLWDHVESGSAALFTGSLGNLDTVLFAAQDVRGVVASSAATRLDGPPALRWSLSRGPNTEQEKRLWCLEIPIDLYILITCPFSFEPWP